MTAEERANFIFNQFDSLSGEKTYEMILEQINLARSEGREEGFREARNLMTEEIWKWQKDHGKSALHARLLALRPTDKE